MDREGTIQALRAAYDTLADLPNFTHDSQEAVMRTAAEALGLKAGQFFGTVRQAVTGQNISPPLFETMEILGRYLSLARIKSAISLLESISAN